MLMRMLRATLLDPMALLAASVALALPQASCASSPPPPDSPNSNVTVVHNGDTTVVSVEDHTLEPENAACKAYCQRLSTCWYAVPNADPMLSQKDVYAKCWGEQQQCRTSTTELFCCGSAAACGDFVKCQTTARDVVTDCRHAPQKPLP